MARIELITTTNLSTGNKRYYMNTGRVGEHSKRISYSEYNFHYYRAIRRECLMSRTNKTHRRSYLVAVI